MIGTSSSLFATSEENDQPVGGKARALAALAAAGFRVPAWFVVLPTAERAAGLEELLCDAVRARFPEEGARLAVRSSAVEEDGAQRSFAGQFESYLDVRSTDVPARVRDVWRSARSAHLQAYRREHGLPEDGFAPAVIVQRMVPAVAAGVAFGIDPVKGRRAVAVVSAVAGLGDRLVSGSADADTWEVDRAGNVTACTVHATAVLTEAQVQAVATLARLTGRHFGRPQDIEWAYDATGELWLLQSRPVTGLDALPEADGIFALWDNANIAESYGGITTPLTFSFARRVYEAVYREFCRLLGVREDRIEAHADTFARMLGLIRGRVYYNLLNWHRVLALLPGYRLNRPFMEGMMGVKAPLPPDAVAELARTDDTGAATTLARVVDALALTRSVLGLIWNAWRLPRRIDRFYARLDEAMHEPPLPLDVWRIDELAAYYRSLERRLVTRWDAPLVNDFFAMIAFGVVRRLAARWYGDESLPNAFLAGAGGIVSAEPVHLLRGLAEAAAVIPELVPTLRDGSMQEIRRALADQPAFARRCEEYLARFGDRCLEELKLETPTLHDDPLTLYRTVGRLAGGLAPVTATEAAPAAEPALPGPRWQAMAFRWLLRMTRDRVRNRENLRFERTRVFGRVRRIVVELGRRLHAAGRLENARDVFYLTLEELLGFVDGTAIAVDFAALVAARRAEYEAYRREPAPPDRFATRGAVGLSRYEAAETTAPAPSASGEERRGLGCCAGIVRGRARVVLDPRGAEIFPGEILVARRTDPGWVLLFPSAAALAVEHGSLLSHSAIVARELKLPAVVSVPGLTDWLRTGDLIELDGAAGLVRRLADSPT